MNISKYIDHTFLKPAGGIRDRETALKMIAAGATRIGTSAGSKLLA